MKMLVLFALSLALVGGSAIYDFELQSQGAKTWNPNGRASRCPKHSPPKLSEAEEGRAVVFDVAPSGKFFSQVELEMQAGTLSDFAGLLMTFSVKDLSHFKLRINDGQNNARFVSTVQISESSVSVRNVWIPWADFKGAHIRMNGRWNVPCQRSEACFNVQPANIYNIAVVLPNGPKASQLVVYSIRASHAAPAEPAIAKAKPAVEPAIAKVGPPAGETLKSAVAKSEPEAARASASEASASASDVKNEMTVLLKSQDPFGDVICSPFCTSVSGSVICSPSMVNVFLTIAALMVFRTLDVCSV